MMLRLMSYSQNLMTRHPIYLSSQLTFLSRRRLAFIFSSQYSILVFGLINRLGWLCQKSELTKMPVSWSIKTKSGLPGRLFLYRRKRICSLLSSFANIFSGRVSRERIACMIFRRCSGVKISIVLLGN